MSMADSFLPIQGSDAEPDQNAGAEPATVAGEPDTEPDVLPGAGADDAATDADEPAVTESSPFRTPTGQSVDPADD